MKEIMKRTGRQQTFFSRTGHSITFYEGTDGVWRDQKGKALRKQFTNGGFLK